MKHFKSSFYSACAGLLILFLITCSSAQGVIKGTVFSDVNRNGMLDADEKGIAGVVVSNQMQAVQTDKDGRYVLPAKDRMIVFVTKPAGYDVPLNPQNIPQFYYIHQPQGSPDGLNFPAISPTGALPSALNFALYKTEKRDEFNALITGDPQMRNSEEVGYFRDDILAKMIGRDAAFYLALGDIAADNLDVYPAYKKALALIGIPAYHVLGNHDENYRVASDEFANETFKSHFGPENYSFNYGRVHFVVLDVIQYSGWNKDKNAQGSYRGFLSAAQLIWLENDLRLVPQDHLIVFCNHIPFYTYSGPNEESVNVVNRTELFKLLKGRNYLLDLSAHLHVIEHFTFDSKAGWTESSPFYSINPGAGCGSWWSGPKDDRGIPISHCMDGAPNGFYLFTFKGNDFSYQFIPAKYDDDFQMRITSSTEFITAEQADSIQIIANIFTADQQSRVFVQVDDGARRLMTRQTMKDPFMTAYMKKYRDKHPSWLSSEVESLHIWMSNLPNGLTSGGHIVRVSAVDSRGKTYSGVRLFQIAGNE